MPESSDRLAELATDDVLRAFALERAPRVVRAAVGFLVRTPTRRLARDLHAFDDAVAGRGLGAASTALLGRLGPQLAASGVEEVPAGGPVLVLANHPGLFDAIALFAALGRDDLRVVALDHPFTAALPRLREHIIVVPPDGEQRSGVVRAMAAQLRAGGAVLTFPAGRIEPDPVVRPEVVDGDAQSDGRVAETLRRLAPGLVVVRATVSGVHTARGLEHPVTRLRRRQEDRDWLGAVLQLLVPSLRTRCVRVEVARLDQADPGEGDRLDSQT